MGVSDTGTVSAHQYTVLVSVEHMENKVDPQSHQLFYLDLYRLNTGQGKEITRFRADP